MAASATFTQATASKIDRPPGLSSEAGLFARAAAATGLGVFVCDLPDETLHWTDSTYDLFGLPRRTAVSRRDIVRLYSEQSLTELTQLRSAAIAECSGFRLDAEIITPAGAQRWIRIAAHVELDNGRPVRLLGTKQDVTKERRELERMRYRAEFDAMTGLANRRVFESRLVELCDCGAAAALLLVDLDGFKKVNDTIGHNGGDECLRQAALRLSAACGDADMVARIGGDEFAVLLASASHGRAERLARNIVEAMRQTVTCGRHSFSLGASVGIALIVDNTAIETYRAADMALYAAKSAGGSGFHTAPSEMFALCA